MHSAGIRSKGVLMDQIMMRIETSSEPESELKTLQKMKPYCRWTSGTWESLGWKWNEVQSTPSHINGYLNTFVGLKEN